MDKLNLENIFPDVPEEFHNKIETILDKIVMEKGKLKRNMRVKTRIILAAAFVIVAGSITANATGLFKWSHKVVKEFGASERQQNDLILKGIAEQKNASATDNGLTINLVQTLQDKNYLYIALDITTSKDIILDNSTRFEYMDVFFAGVDGGYAISSGFISHFSHQTGKEQYSNNMLYVINIQKDPETDFNGKIITLSFKNLRTNVNTILEGEWKLSWITNFNDSTMCYNLNQTYNLSGYDVHISKIEISPLSMTIYFKDFNIEKTDEIISTNWKDTEQFKSIIPEGFKYKDGTFIQVKLFERGGMWSFRSNTGELLYYTAIFNKVVDVDDIENIIFGQNASEIKLLN